MGVLLDRYKTKPMEPRLETMREGSPLYNTDKAMAIQPLASQPVEQPKVDSSNAISSLAEILGPTPAEREAEERRLQKNRQQMLMWTGLFDGLRQLGNLYYTTKGAASQQFNSPYGVVNQEYQQQRQLYNDLANYRRNYATSLYNLRRQIEGDERAKAAHQAQMQWYKNRDEQNARKMDLAEFKAKTDADYKKATLDQKNAINEVRIRLLEGQISKTEADRQYKLIMMGNAKAGTKTTTTKPDGTVTTVVKEPNRRNGKGSSGRRGSLLPRAKGNNTQQTGSLLPK